MPDYDVHAIIAEKIADALEGEFTRIDWNDLGEVTLSHKGRVYRMTVTDITDEME